MKKDAAQTDSEYDSCLGVIDENYLPPSLADFFEEDSIVDQEKEYEKYWVGMPEFVQENDHCYKKLIVSFRTEEDYREFAKLTNLNLTPKSKTIWYPEFERTANSLKRWISDDE